MMCLLSMNKSEKSLDSFERCTKQSLIFAVFANYIKTDDAVFQILLPNMHTIFSGSYHTLVRQAILHGEVRLQIRFLLSIHSVDCSLDTRSSRPHLYQVSPT